MSLTCKYVTAKNGDMSVVICASIDFLGFINLSYKELFEGAMFKDTESV